MKSNVPTSTEDPTSKHRSNTSKHNIPLTTPARRENKNRAEDDGTTRSQQKPSDDAASRYAVNFKDDTNHSRSTIMEQRLEQLEHRHKMICMSKALVFHQTRQKRQSGSPSKTHVCLMFNTKRKRTSSQKRCDTDNTWEEEAPDPHTSMRTFHDKNEASINTLDMRSAHPPRNAHRALTDLHREENEIIENRTRNSGEDGRRHPKIPSRGIPTNQDQNPRVNGPMDEPSTPIRRTVRGHHNKHKAAI